MKRLKTPQYDLDSVGFRLLCETVALSTVSYFSYTPDPGLLKQEYARSIKKSAKQLTSTDKWETEATQAEKDGVEEQKVILQNKEKERNWVDRSVKGDASETGLVKFMQPLLSEEINTHKAWPKGGLEAFREANPVHRNKH